MLNSYVLRGPNDEYLLVVRTGNKKDIKEIITTLSDSRVQKIKNLADEIEKSLYDNIDRGDSSQARSKNKSKSTISDNSRRRKTEDS
jgi:hypothetical protein